MSKRSISIDRLQIRLKGVSPESARAAAGGLGRDLMGELAARGREPGRQRTGDIAHVDAGAVPLASGAMPSELRRTIVAGIAAAIGSAPKNSA
jgi:hypothetical protein